MQVEKHRRTLDTSRPYKSKTALPRDHSVTMRIFSLKSESTFQQGPVLFLLEDVFRCLIGAISDRLRAPVAEPGIKGPTLKAICPIKVRFYLIWLVLHVVIKAQVTTSKCKQSVFRRRANFFEYSGRFKYSTTPPWRPLKLSSPRSPKTHF